MQYLFFGIKSSKKVETELSPDEFNDLFMNKLDYELEKADYKKIKKNISERTFTGAVFRFVWNGWNLFNPISKGNIELVTFKKSIYIRHKIYFIEFFIYSLLFTIIPIMGMFGELIFRFIAVAIIWMVYLIVTLLSASRLINLFNIIIDEINTEK